ncbi:MAG TPA: metallophosphoesterase [Acidobacteriota bacterium]|nr:metallophosphoesterase [Acidobacteriota bacterium]
MLHAPSLLLLSLWLLPPASSDGPGGPALPFPGLPLPSAGQSFRFLVYGDIQHNHREGHNRLVEQMMKEEDVAFIIHPGDISKDDGEGYVKDFLSVAAPLVEHTPFFPSPGNHDVEWGSPASRAGFTGFFRTVLGRLSELPQNAHMGDLQEQKLWYSFEYAGVLFICLDSNLFIDEGKYAATHQLEPYRGLREEQLEWLLDELDRAKNDPAIRARFIFMHHSPFSSDENKPKFGLFGGHPGHREMMINQTIPGLTAGEHRLYLTDLLRSSKVTSVFTGHVHYYERWREVIRNGDSYVHVLNWFVVGNGGVRLRGKPLSDPQDIRELFEDEEVFLAYQQRARDAVPGWRSQLQHAFPNPEFPDGRFHGYVVVEVRPQGIFFQTKDIYGQVRDSGQLSGDLSRLPGLRRPDTVPDSESR